ncbi:MAG TPA: type IV pilus twitching motility protein PilT [Thermoanaerobaculia bacterium]|nr:type IV pilus twitching motility protein PilT [Thermoanaerobaculia bacterium]
MSLENLLRKAADAGGREIHLATSRKITVVTPDGERELRGPEVTAQLIHSVVSPVVPPSMRGAFAAGRAEWTMRHKQLGRIRVVAQEHSASFFFSDAGEEVAAYVAPQLALVTSEPSPTDAMDAFFRQMVEIKASDLHLSAGSPPMMRHDGEMKPLPGHSALNAAELERVLWPIAPQRNREEFEQRHDTDFAYEIEGLSRFRCNFFMDRKGMGAVFRVIPSKIMTAEEMGLSKEILDLCFLSKGLVLVTGPTGSGKSTTLTALVDYINRHRTDHVITIEDPIEFVHENQKCLVNQRQVGEHTDSFKGALRAALREDPDVVLIGEMRDLETVSIALETAETGHLVFGTLHTSSAASTIDRIIDQFPADRQDQIRTMLASSLKGVISQMLCKKIGGGRVPALEVMIVTPPIQNMIRESKVFQIPSTIQTSRKQGMSLMNDAMLDLVRKKVVEPKDAYSKAVDKSGLASMFTANGIEMA